MGECLNDLGYEQMVDLIEDMDKSLRLIRDRKVVNFLFFLKKKFNNKNVFLGFLTFFLLLAEIKVLLYRRENNGFCFVRSGNKSGYRLRN